LKVTLPLLHTLERMQPSHRGIIIAHLDDASRQIIYDSIAEVLRSSEISDARRLRLKQLLHPYKDNLRYLIRDRVSPRQKKKTLDLIGGEGLKPILSAAVPLLVGEFKQLALS